MTKKKNIKLSKIEGDWRNHVLHFGKNKGTPLGSLPENSLEWYASSWFPRSYGDKPIADADIAFRAALDQYLRSKSGPGSVSPSDEAPL